MQIKDFVKRAMEQDKRNIFEKINDVENVPLELVNFYKEANPIDVEITMGGNAVRFYSVIDLNDLQTDYNLPDGRFVIATCNSDPIYLYNDKIYSCCHGSSAIKDEIMAETFEDFLLMID